MKTALILHGTSATPNDNWFPWLKERLEKNGYQVFVPQLPEAEHPNISRYTKYLLSPKKGFTFEENKILIGHSSGAVAVLGLLQSLPVGARLGNCYMVSAFKQSLGWESLKDLFNPPFDYSKIKGKAKKLIFIHGDKDPFCPLAETQELAAKLNGEMHVIPDKKHFSISTDGSQYKQFPYLLDLILKQNPTASS